MIDKPALFTFLDESFKGMQSTMNRCEAIGFPWASKSFIKEDKGEIVSHVGFLEYPIMINGKRHKMGAIHAVCTKESYRGKHLASELIKEVLDWASQSHEAVILYTGIPDFYRRLTFKLVQEHRFHLPLVRKFGTKALQQIVTPRDDALFKRLYKEAVPLSQRVWVQDDGTIASFNALFGTFPKYWSLFYSPSLDAIISWRVENKTLHLYDVIANPIPTLEMLLEHLPNSINKIYFYFSPDVLCKEAVPEPLIYDEGYLMVHGEWKVNEPFMVPPLSRC